VKRGSPPACKIRVYGRWWWPYSGYACVAGTKRATEPSTRKAGHAAHPVTQTGRPVCACALLLCARAERIWNATCERVHVSPAVRTEARAAQRTPPPRRHILRHPPPLVTAPPLTSGQRHPRVGRGLLLFGSSTDEACVWSGLCACVRVCGRSNWCTPYAIEMGRPAAAPCTYRTRRRDKR
jgi:hypothetical protein